MTARLEESSATLEESLAERDIMRAQLDEAIEARDVLKGGMERLETETEQIGSERDQALADLQAGEELWARLEGDYKRMVSEATEERERAEAIAKVRASEIEAAREQLSELSAACEDKAARLAATLRVIETVRRTVLADVAELGAEADEPDAAAEELDAEVEELDAELEELDAEVEELDAEIEQLDEEATLEGSESFTPREPPPPPPTRKPRATGGDESTTAPEDEADLLEETTVLDKSQMGLEPEEEE